MMWGVFFFFFIFEMAINREIDSVKNHMRRVINTEAQWKMSQRAWLVSDWAWGESAVRRDCRIDSGGLMRAEEGWRDGPRGWEREGESDLFLPWQCHLSGSGVKSCRESLKSTAELCRGTESKQHKPHTVHTDRQTEREVRDREKDTT